MKTSSLNLFCHKATVKPLKCFQLLMLQNTFCCLDLHVLVKHPPGGVKDMNPLVTEPICADCGCILEEGSSNCINCQSKFSSQSCLLQSSKWTCRICDFPNDGEWRVNKLL